MIYNEDFLENDLEDESIDLIVTDPPYEVQMGGSGEATNLRNPSGVIKKGSQQLFEEIGVMPNEYMDEFYRLLKPETHCYVMTNNLNLERTLREARKTGFGFHNQLIWKKQNATPNRWYMQNCEYILMFFKPPGTRYINNCSEKQLFEIPQAIGDDKHHPTEKPVELFDRLINNSSKEGELVLDPFMGSGSSAVSAFKNNRRYIGFEIDEKYYKVAEKRMENEREKTQFFELNGKSNEID